MHPDRSQYVINMNSYYVVYTLYVHVGRYIKHVHCNEKCYHTPSLLGEVVGFILY